MENQFKTGDLPVLLDVKALRNDCHLSRSMAYALLNRQECGAVQIGGRKFLYRDAFFEWLKDQAKNGGKVAG